MATEALWVQDAGVTYTAAEDRKLFPAIWGNEGILHGLTVTPGAGRSVSVAAGRATVDDGGGGYYVAFLDAAAEVSLSANSSGTTRTDLIYLQVNPTTAAVTVGALPGSVSTPANAVALSHVSVPSGTSTITESNISAGTRVPARVRNTVYEVPPPPGAPDLSPYLRRNVSESTTGFVNLAGGAAAAGMTVNGQATVNGLIHANEGRFNLGIYNESNQRQRYFFAAAYANADATITAAAADGYYHRPMHGVGEVYTQYGSGGVAGGGIQVPVTGTYLVTANCALNAASTYAGGFCAIAVGTDVNWPAGLASGTLNSSGNLQLNASGIIRVSAGGYIHMWFRRGSSGNAITARTHVAGYPSYMHVMLLRAD